MEGRISNGCLFSRRDEAGFIFDFPFMGEFDVFVGLGWVAWSLVELCFLFLGFVGGCVCGGWHGGCSGIFFVSRGTRKEWFCLVTLEIFYFHEYFGHWVSIST